MPPLPALEITGLTKSFGDHAVLRGVDLTVAAGTIHAPLGSNGAGKTTLVLATLLRAGGGTATVCLLRLLEDRGWTGRTKVRRAAPRP